MAKFNNPISDKPVTQQTWHGTFPEMLVIILKSPGPERGMLESPDLWEFPSRSLDDKYRLVVVLVVLINTTIILAVPASLPICPSMFFFGSV